MPGRGQRVSGREARGEEEEEEEGGGEEYEQEGSITVTSVARLPRQKAVVAGFQRVK